MYHGRGGTGWLPLGYETSRAIRKDTPPERPTSLPPRASKLELSVTVTKSGTTPTMCTDHCRWAFSPLGWSCETVEPARDACLGCGMSPDVTFPERLFPTCPRARPRASIGRYSLMSRDGPDGINHCRRAFHPLSWLC